MRICVLTDTAPVASQTFVRFHVMGLRADLVALRANPEALMAWDWRPPTWSLYEGEAPGRTLAQRLGARLREVTIGGRPPCWPPAMERLWRQYLRERRPDVVLAEFGPNGMLGLAGCREVGIPLIVHFHGYDASSLLRFSAYRRRLPPLFATARAVVVVGRHMVRRLVELGCPREKIHRIPCGAEVTRIPQSRHVAAEPCRFLAVGRIEAHKGPLVTLRAFRDCLHRVGAGTLDLVGDGRQLPRARRWVARHGLNSQVTFHGAKPSSFVTEMLARSSVFVQHSQRTRTGAVEGWGVSLAEGAAAGLPVVATRIGGIPDQVLDGQTGLLVSPGDGPAMAEAMIRLARDPARRVQMGQAGRQNIRRIGDANQQLEQLNRLLHSVVPREQPA